MNVGNDLRASYRMPLLTCRFCTQVKATSCASVVQKKQLQKSGTYNLSAVALFKGHAPVDEAHHGLRPNDGDPQIPQRSEVGHVPLDVRND
jgi:hypothetical protein